MNLQTDILIAPCIYQAAKYAVEHWHYSKSMPAAKLIHYGVWEDNKFIGTIIFGASATQQLGKSYGLTQFQRCERVRIALKDHRCFVSDVVSKAVKLLKESNPGLRLIFSYADTKQGHEGKIYQAMNWIYTGTSPSAVEYIYKGVRYHGRSFREKYGAGAEKRLKNVQQVHGSIKHRYLYPLDRKMRKQILPLAQPYPKHADQPTKRDGLGDQPSEIGAIPMIRSNTTSNNSQEPLVNAT